MWPANIFSPTGAVLSTKKVGPTVPQNLVFRFSLVAITKTVLCDSQRTARNTLESRNGKDPVFLLRAVYGCLLCPSGICSNTAFSSGPFWHPEEIQQYCYFCSSPAQLWLFSKCSWVPDALPDQTVVTEGTAWYGLLGGSTRNLACHGAQCKRQSICPSTSTTYFVPLNAYLMCKWNWKK